MKFEFSAGGVVYRNDRGKLEVLVSQHSFHHGWVFPKGLIGDRDHIKDEKKEDTAIREVKEETGAEGEIVQELTPITYWYVMEEIKRRKTVYYFIMHYTGGDITQHDHEMENVEWLPAENVTERLTYKSDKKVFAEARPIIENLLINSFRK
ncbi:MAG: NUDIX domain-containing protein [Candidatus Levybacteria bacterium]|nr:NUDIX domain-containing protein [Candidatus Levybacteria bacterium]MBP9815109.1 NUDIX domain-containing protein [Candidatus Levybacteria bacterium]